MRGLSGAGVVGTVVNGVLVFVTAVLRLSAEVASTEASNVFTPRIGSERGNPQKHNQVGLYQSC